MVAVHFTSATDFHCWLKQHHAATGELLVGFYKKASGKGGLTYPEAVDELLCFGWIDGVKRRVDDARYTHRITPRRPGSIWSVVKLRHLERLPKSSWTHPAGLTAFAARQENKTRIYSFENRPQPLPPEFENYRSRTSASRGDPVTPFFAD